MVDESYTASYKKRPIVYAFVYKLQPATKIRAKQKARTFIRAHKFCCICPYPAILGMYVRNWEASTTSTSAMG